MKSFAYDFYGGMVPPGLKEPTLLFILKDDGTAVEVVAQEKFVPSFSLWARFLRRIGLGRFALIRVVQGSVLETLPQTATRIVGWEGAISSFGPRSFPYTPGMHVDTWLSLQAMAPGNKQGPNAFGILKTGDSGHDSNGLMGLNIALPTNNLVSAEDPTIHEEITQLKFWINFWVHNMRSTTDDFHVGYTIYYEEN
jgi:hypothetical protein